MNARSRIVFSIFTLQDLELEIPFSIVCDDAIFLIGNELVRGLLAEDNMRRCLHQGGLSAPSSSFLFSRNAEPCFVLEGRFKPSFP